MTRSHKIGWLVLATALLFALWRLPRLHGQGFGSFSHDQPFLAADRVVVYDPLTAGLIAWYDLEANYTDSGTNNIPLVPMPINNPANIYTNHPIYTNGFIGNSAIFPGYQYSSNVLFATESNVTVAAWVKLYDKSAYETILKTSEITNATKYGYQLSYASDLDRFYFQVATNGTQGNYVVANTFGSPSLNTWYLIMAWFDGSTVNISVNNGAANTAPLVGPIYPMIPFHLSNTNIPSGLPILYGELDSVAVWNRVLTSGERTRIYNSGAGLSFARASSYWLNIDVIAGHSLIKNSKVYCPLYSQYTTPTTKGGIMIYDPDTATISNRLSIDDVSLGQAPVFDTNGYIHLWAWFGRLYRVSPALQLSNTLTGFESNIDWETLTYDATHNFVFAPKLTNLVAVNCNNYTFAWTNSDVSLHALDYNSLGPVMNLWDTNLYLTDLTETLYRIDAATGATLNKTNLGGAPSYFTYSHPIYDITQDHIYVFGGTYSNTVYAVSRTNLYVVWTNILPEGKNLFRGGATYNGKLFVTIRDDGPSWKSIVYGLNVTNGATLWTNKTVYNENAAVSWLICDSTHAYGGTYDYVDGTYTKAIAFNADTGAADLVKDLVSGVSSAIPCASNGRLLIPLWNNRGMQSLQVKTGGTKRDIDIWKYDSFFTGFVGDRLSGSLVP